MDCERVRDLLLEERGNLAGRADAATHVESCRACQDDANAYSIVRTLMGEVPRGMPTASVLGALEAAAAAEAARVKRGAYKEDRGNFSLARFLFRPVVGLVAAGGVAVAVVIVTSVDNGGTGSFSRGAAPFADAPKGGIVRAIEKIDEALAQSTVRDVPPSLVARERPKSKVAPRGAESEDRAVAVVTPATKAVAVVRPATKRPGDAERREGRLVDAKRIAKADMGKKEGLLGVLGASSDKELEKALESGLGGQLIAKAEPRTASSIAINPPSRSPSLPSEGLAQGYGTGGGVQRYRAAMSVRIAPANLAAGDLAPRKGGQQGSTGVADVMPSAPSPPKVSPAAPPPRAMKTQGSPPSRAPAAPMKKRAEESNWLDDAQTAVRDGRFVDAEEMIVRREGKNPRSATASLLLAASYFGRKLWREAASLLDALLERDLGDSEFERAATLLERTYVALKQTNSDERLRALRERRRSQRQQKDEPAAAEIKSE